MFEILMRGCNLSKPPGTGLDMDCVKAQSNEIYSDTFCVFSVFVKSVRKVRKTTTPVVLGFKRALLMLVETSSRCGDYDGSKTGSQVT